MDKKAVALWRFQSIFLRAMTPCPSSSSSSSSSQLHWLEIDPDVDQWKENKDSWITSLTPPDSGSWNALVFDPLQAQVLSKLLPHISGPSSPERKDKRSSSTLKRSQPPIRNVYVLDRSSLSLAHLDRILSPLGNAPSATWICVFPRLDQSFPDEKQAFSALVVCAKRATILTGCCCARQWARMWALLKNTPWFLEPVVTSLQAWTKAWCVSIESRIPELGDWSVEQRRAVHQKLVVEDVIHFTLHVLQHS